MLVHTALPPPLPTGASRRLRLSVDPVCADLRKLLNSVAMDSLRIAARKVTEGRTEAFRVIVERTHPRLVQLGLRILGDRSEAEDVVQEAYVNAHQARIEGRFDDRASDETWTVRIITPAA